MRWEIKMKGAKGLGDPGATRGVISSQLVIQRNDAGDDFERRSYCEGNGEYTHKKRCEGCAHGFTTQRRVLTSDQNPASSCGFWVVDDGDGDGVPSGAKRGLFGCSVTDIVDESDGGSLRLSLEGASEMMVCRVNTADTRSTHPARKIKWNTRTLSLGAGL
jgi:hypothetical protein